MRPVWIARAGALALVSLLASAGAASAQQQDPRPVRSWSFSEVRRALSLSTSSGMFGPHLHSSSSGGQVARFVHRARNLF